MQDQCISGIKIFSAFSLLANCLACFPHPPKFSQFETFYRKIPDKISAFQIQSQNSLKFKVNSSKTTFLSQTAVKNIHLLKNYTSMIH